MTTDVSVLKALAKDGIFTSGRIAQRWPYDYHTVRQQLEDMVDKGYARKGVGPRGGIRFFPTEPDDVLTTIQNTLNTMPQDVKELLGKEGIKLLVYAGESGLIAEDIS